MVAESAASSSGRLFLPGPLSRTCPTARALGIFRRWAEILETEDGQSLARFHFLQSHFACLQVSV